MNNIKCSNHNYYIKAAAADHLSYLSYCWFLEDGLRDVIRFHALTESRLFSLHMCFDKKRAITAPRWNFEEARLFEATYAVGVYVRVKTCYRQEEPYILPYFNGWEKSSYNFEDEEDKQQNVVYSTIKLLDLPLIHHGKFLYNGTIRVLLAQLVRAPGLYFARNNTVLTGTFVPEKGGHLKIILEEIGPKKFELYFDLGQGQTLPSYLFLRVLGLSEREIRSSVFELISLNDFFIQYAALSQKELLKAFSTNILTNRQFRAKKFTSILEARKSLIQRFFNPLSYNFGRVGRKRLNKCLNLRVSLGCLCLTKEDIVGVLIKITELYINKQQLGSLDHITNRRVVAAGSLIARYVTQGLSRLSRRCTNYSEEHKLTEYLKYYSASMHLVKQATEITSSIRELFTTTPLSQYLDQINPLGELAHKRRLQLTGPGGLSSEHVPLSARFSQRSHERRFCPVETPEGKRIGLVIALAQYAIPSADGFILFPYKKVMQGKIQPEIHYLDIEQERNVYISSWKQLAPHFFYKSDTIREPFFQKKINATRGGKMLKINFNKLEYIDLREERHAASVAISLPAFGHHNDTIRCLMSSNMQRQSVALLHPEPPTCLVPADLRTNLRSGVISSTSGKVVDITEKDIKVYDVLNNCNVVYKLKKFSRSNHGTCINHSPAVSINEKVIAGQTLAHGPSSLYGTTAIGQSLLLAYMPLAGLNFEDGLVVSSELSYSSTFKSVTFIRLETELRETENGNEVITRNLPEVTPSMIRNLDENGLVKVGSWVEPGDMLVGKITPNPDLKTVKTIEFLCLVGSLPFCYSLGQNTSLIAPQGTHGRVHEIFVFNKKKQNSSPDVITTGQSRNVKLRHSSVTHVIKLLLSECGDLKVGDKMSGRHGNKGVVCRLVPTNEMPYLMDGTPLDMLVNPMGIPSRMNVGQIFEATLGILSYHLDSVSYGVDQYGDFSSKLRIGSLQSLSTLEKKIRYGGCKKCHSNGPDTGVLIDGVTGALTGPDVMLGVTTILKLIHMVDEKVYARSTGEYAQITQQPVSGRARCGGQRVGEMEIWAIHAYNAAYTLQEFLTIKSDDPEGRNDTFTAIVNGEHIHRSNSRTTHRASYTQLTAITELQGLCLDIQSLYLAK